MYQTELKLLCNTAVLPNDNFVPLLLKYLSSFGDPPNISLDTDEGRVVPPSRVREWEEAENGKAKKSGF